MAIGSKRAILLVLNNKVEPIENYKEMISSQYIKLKLPSVIRLKHYVSVNKKEIIISKKNILKRDNNICQYCGIKSLSLTIDHIEPKDRGGRNTWYNLVAACMSCNSRKGNKTLIQANMKLIKKPRKPNLILHLQTLVNKSKDSWRPYLFMKEKK